MKVADFEIVWKPRHLSHLNHGKIRGGEVVALVVKEPDYCRAVASAARSAREVRKPVEYDFKSAVGTDVRRGFVGEAAIESNGGNRAATEKHRDEDVEMATERGISTRALNAYQHGDQSA